MNVHEAIIKVMGLVGSIQKTRTNTQGQGYKFRGIDDVYLALHEHMASVGLYSSPEVLEDRVEDRQSKSGGNLIYRILKIKYHFFAADGSTTTATVIGEAMDSGDKASNKAMAVAHKYALLQIFCIPTDEPKDPENETHEAGPSAGQAKSHNPKATIIDGDNLSAGELSYIKAEVEKNKLTPDERTKLWSVMQGKTINDISNQILIILKARVK